MDTVRLLQQERADLAAFCWSLSPDDWERPSLCEGWRVRDVVAHVISVDDVPLRQHLVNFARARLSADAFNAIGVDARKDWTTQRLTDELARQVDVGRLSRLRRGMLALTDALVHHQDIRRPLGRPRTIPNDRLLAVLMAPDPFAGTRRRMKGLRFVATDVDWSRGDGPEVRGPGEALIMSIHGRAAALADLEGAGKDALAQRL